MKTKNIAISGLITALQVLTLSISYIIPTINLALLFAASLYPGILLRIGIGRKAVFVSVAASSVLTIFLIQIPVIQGGFIAFFGWYALIHQGTIKMGMAKKQLFRWAFFALSAGLMYLAVLFIFPVELKYALWIFVAAGIAAFVIMQALYEFTVRELIKKTKIKSIDGKITFK